MICLVSGAVTLSTAVIDVIIEIGVTTHFNFTLECLAWKRISILCSQSLLVVNYLLTYTLHLFYILLNARYCSCYTISLDEATGTLLAIEGVVVVDDDVNDDGVIVTFTVKKGILKRNQRTRIRIRRSIIRLQRI